MESLDGALVSVLQMPSVDHQSLIQSLVQSLIVKVQALKSVSANPEQSVSDISSRLQAVHHIALIQLSKTACATECTCGMNPCSNHRRRVTLRENMSECVRAVLIPLLQIHNVSLGSDTVTSSGLVTLTCDLLVTCLKFADNSTKLFVWNICLESLRSHKGSSRAGVTVDTEDRNTGAIDLVSLIELFSGLLKVHKHDKTPTGNPESDTDNIFPDDCWSDRIFQEIMPILADGDDSVVSKVVSLVLVKLYRCEPQKLLHRLSKTWETIEEIFDKSVILPSSGEGGSSSVSEKPYIALCGLADFYFPVGPVSSEEQVQHFSLMNNTAFWTIIQNGLIQKNPVTRKRSLYLLKRIIDICDSEADSILLRDLQDNTSDDKSARACTVFRWPPEFRPQLSKIWETFILLIETLNEKQFHVVRPLFSRLNHLIEACSKTESLGYPLLHPSWVVTVIRRSVIHESVHVVMWGVKSLLQTDPQHFPVLEHGQDVYISGEFLAVLKETRLYCRQTEHAVGSQPETGSLMSNFLLACWKTLALPKRAVFFKRILETIRGDNWGQLPLIYLSQALAGLPMDSLWDKEAFMVFREILKTNLATVDQFSRGVIQGFLTEALLNLMDLDVVTLQDLAVVLAVCSKEESLQRGTTLWHKVSSRLNQIADDSKSPEKWRRPGLERGIQNSVVQHLKAEDKSAPGFPLHLSRMILLLVDGSGPSSTKPFLDSCLSPMTDILSRLIGHAYLSHEKADRAVGLLISLVDEAAPGCDKEDSVMKSLLTTTAQFLEEITHQIMRRKDDLKCTSDLPVLQFYLHVLKSFCLPHLIGHVGGRRILEVLSDLVKWSVMVTDKLTCNADQRTQITENGQMTRLVAMAILGTVTEIIHAIRENSPSSDWSDQMVIRDMYCFGSQLKIEPGLLKPKGGKSEREGSISQNAWGKVTNLYLHTQWQCVEFSLTTGTEAPPRLTSPDLWAEALVLGAEDSVLPVISCLQKLLPMYLESGQETVVVQAIERVWCRLKEDCRLAIFWRELRAFAAMAYQQPLLAKADKESPITGQLTKYAKELLSQGEERSGVANVLVTQLCAIFSQGIAISAAAHFSAIVAEACVFGSLLQRVDKTWFETCAYIDSLKDACSANQLFPFIGSPDVMVRVTVINFLTKLRPQSEESCRFASDLVLSLIHKHHHINRTNSAWNFANSLQHRLRQRLIQGLLILEPFIQSQELTQTVWEYIWSMLTHETQPSVRNLLEWLALRLLVRHHHLHPTLWSLFEVTSLTEKRHMCLCSLLFIVSHLGAHLPPGLQESYYSKAIVVVFTWSTVHHFNTRIHAQVSLKKLWGQCQEYNLRPLMEKYPIIQTCMDFRQEESNSTKNAEKLEAHYIFSTFNVEDDYSIETIYETFPRLSCLSDEEWIAPNCFSRSDLTWKEAAASHSLPLFNANDRLKKFTPGPWRLKGEETYANYAEVEMLENGDVQKKILPWRFMKPDAEAEEQLQLRRVKKRGHRLILVTSLIEKIPNLGGLCRTSEIFGVSEFVVSNLQHLNDKAFQSLSVTAHKWLSVTEVKLFQLKEYMLSKRRAGYTLVGVEQTANSVCLSQYQFPEKTLLLLGNEKEGIPANLIQFLDTCVEIPQQGVIRSLNVHVSGALFVWEYTRQQLAKSETKT